MQKYCDYQGLIDSAMRNVIKEVLHQVEKSGLLDGHYFFINFNTTYPGVKISDRLKHQYPEEMIIVLQYQFDDLVVHDKYFTIALTFHGIKELIEIPFASIIEFNDPSVNFLLQLDNMEDADYDMDEEDDDMDLDLDEEENDNDNNVRNKKFLTKFNLTKIKKEGNLIDITDILKNR